MNFFNKKKKKEKSKDSYEAILDLKSRLIHLDKREIFLEKKISSCTAEAKTFVSKKLTRKATTCLKKKKLYEREINNIENTKLSIEQQIITLESAINTMEIVKAMKTGKDSLKNQLNEGLDLESIDETMDDIKENIDDVNSVNEAISQPIDDNFDEDELLEELNALQDTELEKTLEKPKDETIKNEELNLPEVPDGNKTSMETISNENISDDYLSEQMTQDEIDLEKLSKEIRGS